MRKSETISKVKTRTWSFKVIEAVPDWMADFDDEMDNWHVDYQDTSIFSLGRPRKRKEVKEVVPLNELLEYRLIATYAYYCAFQLGVRIKPYDVHKDYKIVRKHRDPSPTRQPQVKTEQTESKEVAALPSASPELDTVRVYFDCASIIDLDKFLPDTATKKIRTCVKDALGNYHDDYEFYRNEMSMSWYGKMQISKENKYWGKNAINRRPVLSFEFSVAKWNHCASAVNSGDTPCAESILLPCVQAMVFYHIDNYSNLPMKRIIEDFLKYSEIRRFDLSINFQVPEIYTPTEYVQVLSRCFCNQQKAHVREDGSIYFATEKSPYRVIFYDKTKEAESFYTRFDPRPPVLFTDEKGEQQLFDYNIEKERFYEKNKDLFRQKLRFEVQFRSKFIQEHNMNPVGKENIDNIIRLGVFYWKEVLNQFDQQLAAANFSYTEDQKEPIAKALATLEDRRDEGIYSATKANNMHAFIVDCYKKGSDVIRKKIGSSLFSQYRKWVLTELNLDVKVALPKTLPIMRIM